MPTNIVLATDSYKLNHWNQYPKGTEAVYSYFESRVGATFPETVFFGLQYIIKEFLEGKVVTQKMIDQASGLSISHFGNGDYFNRAGWQHILDNHDGKLPIRIKAVSEGTPVPTGNVLMTVENTCPKCFWLTNALESLLTHVWYPSTVASLSYATKKLIKGYLDETAESDAGLPFMLHDFGYRGASSHESAAIGGAAHLVNFLGTDTLPAMLCAMEYYDASMTGLGLSVAATEHSVMTALGREGEFQVLDNLLDEYPSGILSVVSDSYDIIHFVGEVGKRADRIKARDGVFVVRPDSVTPDFRTPGSLVVKLAKMLRHDFGAITNEKGYLVLDPHVRILWGDGIDFDGINQILDAMQTAGFSAENMVFGMGGGLLQKVNRDTQRFAFKASAMKRDGEWHNVSKTPLDVSKASKAGRLILSRDEGGFTTLNEGWANEDLLEVVFEDGKLMREQTFAEVRANAEEGLRNSIDCGMVLLARG